MSIRTLSVDFLFYGLLDLLQRSVGLIMVPVYTRVLSQGEYGDLDIVIIVSAVLAVLVDLQFQAGFSRLYLERHSAGEGRRFAGTAMAARLIGGLLVPAAAIAAGFSGYLEFSFLPSFENNKALWGIMLASVPFTLAQELLLLQARMLRWKRTFAVGALSTTIVSGIASVLLVTAWQWGSAGVAAGLLIGRLVGLALLGWSLRTEIAICLDRVVLRALGPYSLPLVPGWWLSFATAYMGRFFVYGVSGAEQNAILAVCMKIASLIGLYSASYRSAWYPLAMSHIGKHSGEAFYVSSMRMFMAGGLFSILCMAALLQPLLKILAPGTYSSVEIYFPLFVVGKLIGECDVHLQLGNHIAKRTHWISISGLVYALANLTVLILFTKILGIFAVGLGLVVAGIGKSLVTYYSGQRHYPIAYDKRAFAIMAAGCAVLLVVNLGFLMPSVPAWAPRGVLALAAASLPWLMLRASEREFVKAFAFKRWQDAMRQA